MDIKQAINFINSRPEEYLKRARQSIQGRPSYICPLCGNGSGESGTGIVTQDGIHYHCFKCGFHGDIVQLIAQEKGIEDGGSSAAILAACEVYGITIDKKAGGEFVTQPEGRDKSEYIKAHCNENADFSYLEGRGISRETALRLGFGYDAARKSVIIPITNEDGLFYIERLTDPSGPLRYSLPKGTKAGLFNEAALDGEGPVFITEGAINAASIEEAGGHALAINSASNAAAFIRKLEKRGSRCNSFIICMDNDEAGKAAAQTLTKGLERLSKAFFSLEVKLPYNDANDALRGNRGDFLNEIKEAIENAEHPGARQIEAHKIKALLPLFREYILNEYNNKPIKTGFPSFDEAIGGGLLPKLYIIGAVTSLGKTTFALQMADNIAAAGNDVIIFSLEMAKEDIIARSISRHTYEMQARPGGNTSLSKTELGVVMGSRYAGYSEEEKALIGIAFKKYAEYASEHISIYEGKRTADEIRRIVEEYISFTGKRPVVVVDYLQILQPAADLKRATVREQTDYNIDVFTAMRRELKVPIIGISSFNRQSYITVADNSSFKESGAIEYSGDCIITLELDFERVEKGTESDKQNKTRDRIREAMRAEPREIKLTFQKNRGNKVGTVIYFRYNPKFNYFDEDLTKESVL